ncbi:SCP2 domain-containing protein [Vibrio navarrensis]|uniref:Ubiquinone biosynthesis accessory factor UbiJ n=1 Tax=Vibrio navarrensis TaxID=29495 RepID=A0AAI9CW10_9VIBR|nr:SCP2 domain-containing protein [Vibrio navarrensis]EJL6394940.1 SCP2 domain-containing protein [Vibrio navarrensis]EKA5636718.1 SCP2 domain-containing protein [Vibrio navarrensis]ELN6933462.1 SCP2 domain-containing protein [Vibrio navarrensis]
MPFAPLITAAIETTLNVLFKDNPDLQRRLLRLKGQVIQIHLKELNQTLTFVFSQQIDVLADYEGQPDCYLSLNLSVLPQLREQANITRLIKQDQLVLEGDIQLAQKFVQLMTDAKPDVEEWLSRVTGDVVAHSAVQGARNAGEFLRAQAKKHQNHLGQVLTEEWRVAPGPLEVAHFCDQVDDLQSATAQLEARLTRLLEKA